MVPPCTDINIPQPRTPSKFLLRFPSQVHISARAKSFSFFPQTGPRFCCSFLLCLAVDARSSDAMLYKHWPHVQHVITSPTVLAAPSHAAAPRGACDGIIAFQHGRGAIPLSSDDFVCNSARQGTEHSLAYLGRAIYTCLCWLFNLDSPRRPPSDFRLPSSPYQTPGLP